MALLGSGCTRYEHSNPFDPENPSSQRPLKPAVLAFVHNNGSDSANADHKKAYDAYTQIETPSYVLSFEVPKDTLTASNSLTFLKKYWEVMTGPRPVPRVFTGANTNPVVGIADTEEHLDTIQKRIAQLLIRPSYWTIEAKAAIANTNRLTIQIDIARLGSSPSDSIEVMAFTLAPQTEAWGKATYAFEPKKLDSFEPAERKKTSFSRDLTAAELALPRVCYVLILCNGIIEQGSLF